jgi:hypothetical protein
MANAPKGWSLAKTTEGVLGDGPRGKGPEAARGDD